MGKYMKKGKITGDIAVMEVSQSVLGVRTRAKTLALQRLQLDNNGPPISESSYLQLRNRRLEKRNQQQQSCMQNDGCSQNPNPNPNPNSSGRVVSSRLGLSSVNSVSVSKEEGFFGNFQGFSREGDETEKISDFGVEASFGENNFEIEGRERSTRESTPCSFIRDLDAIGTPGSTTRPISSTAANRRTRSAQQRNIPTTHELEEFFACAEREEQRLFAEKYNFDIINDVPLPGRYEWARVDL